MSSTSKLDEKCVEKTEFDDIIIRYLGQFGTYQRIIFFLVCLPTIITAMDSLSWTFSGIKIPHRCRGSTEVSTANYWKPDDPSSYSRENCTLVNSVSSCPYTSCKLGNLDTCPYGYVYNNEAIKLSAIQKWDIVCEFSVIRAVIQSTYYAGQMFGSLVFGFLGDRIGRKKVFFLAIVIQFFSGITMSLAPHWILYGIGRFFVGFAHPGIFVIAVVIGMELIGPKYRRLASISPAISWAIGQMILGVMASYIRDYQYLHAAIALPALFFVGYWCIIPESARWLVAHKRFDEADKILQKAARINKATLPANWYKELEKTQEQKNEKLDERRYNFIDILRTPSIRKRSLPVFLCWPICSMMYYGLSMNTSFLGGDLYLTFIFGGVSEIPAVILTYFLLDIIGRKTVLAGSFFVAAFAMISNLITGETNVIFGITQSLIAKSAVASAYATLYTFTPELFPTVIRNLAMGGCSMMARFGAISASFISMWLFDRFGSLVMVIPFSALGLLAGMVVILFLPETKGRKLAESIEDIENKHF
uniref:Major facilitator superfamily (MFS) profile domain-containing protein n=1 Tax=Panagrolaimus sp. JU765 TaxID=591449 RepID=A0AC34RJ45_9BILA